jgi:hypothetical protein
MNTLTLLKSSLILTGISLLAMSPALAQTAPTTPPDATVPAEHHHHHLPLPERIARLQKHEQRIENRINSGKLTGDELTKAQTHLSKIQNRLAKLEAKEGKTT